MSILINKSTRVIIQGITDREASFHSLDMLNYGTQIVAGLPRILSDTEFGAVYEALTKLELLGVREALVGNLGQIALARRVLVRLRESGEVYRVSTELYYDAETVASCKRAVAEALRSGAEGTVAGLKGAMGGISRKFAVPLLEAFDAEGFTVREGDTRTLPE